MFPENRREMPTAYDAIWAICEWWSEDDGILKIDHFSDGVLPPDGGNLRIFWKGKVVFWGYNLMPDGDEDEELRHCYIYIPGEWEQVVLLGREKYRATK